jgi:hypothetical protein
MKSNSKNGFFILIQIQSKTKMAEDRTNLRAAASRFVALDEQIKELNARVSQLRETRSIIELEIADILRQPEYATFDKLNVNGEEIKVKRPGYWNNPWSLSQSALERYSAQYINSTANHSVTGFIEYIKAVYGQTRVSNRFSLTR